MDKKNMEWSDYFESRKRRTGEYFTCLKDEAPDILVELIRKIHKELGTGLPDDWAYDKIQEAFESAERDEIGCVYTDDMTGDLIHWVENNWARGFCNEVLENGEAEGCTTLDEIIMRGQGNAIQIIISMVEGFRENENVEDYKKEQE